jgi:hypothetical protein
MSIFTGIGKPTEYQLSSDLDFDSWRQSEGVLRILIASFPESPAPLYQSTGMLSLEHIPK